jgi:lipooligosaccharide transport system permease protein
VIAVATARRATRLMERNLVNTRHIWITVASGFFEPLFYLFSVSVGISKLVGTVNGPHGHPIAYTAFVAPALLGASAMNGAVYDSTFNFFHKLKFAKLYDAILSTPLGIADVAVGEVAWALGRGAMYSIVFLVIMLVMGLIHSWWALLALPACMLIGFAFAACGMAGTTFMRGWQDFDFVNLATLPLFLLSATFYPLSTYPPIVRTLTQISPLYHGVALLRSLTLGSVGLPALGHIAFLGVMGAVGLSVVRRRLTQLLLH